jgi:hypothetical protein
VSERAELTVKIADVKQHSVRRFESQALLTEALQSLPASDRPIAIALRLELAHDHFWRGEFAQMREMASRVSSRARDRASPMVVPAMVLTSPADFYQARAADARTGLAEAETASGALADEPFGERIMLSTQIGLLACRLEQFDDARAHVRRGLRVSRETGQSFIIPTLLRVEANALLMQGQLREAVRAGEAGVDSALVSGNDRLLMWALEAVSVAAYWAGDIDPARASALEALACAERTGEPFFEALSRCLLDLGGAHGWVLLIEAHLALGELGDAEEVATRALERTEAAALPQQVAAMRCARAAVMLARGQARAAVAAARAAAGRFERAGNPLLSARARAVAGGAPTAAGEREEALAELVRAHSVLSACGASREAEIAGLGLRRLGHRVPRRARSAAPGAGLSGLRAHDFVIDGSAGVWTRLTPPARPQVPPVLSRRAGGASHAQPLAGFRHLLSRGP